MNPILLYNIFDAKGNILFQFPPNTLLEKIIDVWPLIMNYYENYNLFSIGAHEGYRPVTLEEFKTNGFIKSFSSEYRKKKIICSIYDGLYNRRLFVGPHPLYIKHDSSSESIFIERDCQKLYTAGGYGDLCHYDIADRMEYMFIDERTLLSGCMCISLYILSDIVFD